MKIKELIKALENINTEMEIQIVNPEMEIQIEDDKGYHHKAIWIMYYKGELTIGWEEEE